jgi:hypothetical protein
MLQRRRQLATFWFASWQPVKSMAFAYVDLLLKYQPLYLAQVYLYFSMGVKAVFAISHFIAWP